ncbi:MAG: diaminopimelate epimerase [Bacteroidia bacterium]
MITFYKYQGTGNDFIMIDNRDKKFVADLPTIKKLCDRRFGIGADGLILLENVKDYDFSMVYFNSDGNESTMCGNGGRCITAFAAFLGVIKKNANFIAIDGGHEAEIYDSGIVSLKMKDVSVIEKSVNDFILDTGSPHFVRFVDKISDVDVFSEGRKIRRSERFAAKGINVNFVELKDGILNVRTYERGVEDETLSCGTGVTASALAVASADLVNGKEECLIAVPGGSLKVKYKKQEKSFIDIWLEGPAEFVFKGEIEL